MAPEIIAGNKTTKKADIFSLGILMFILYLINYIFLRLTGRPPFKGKNMKEVIFHNAKGKIKLTENEA